MEFTAGGIIKDLKAMGNEKAKQGMERFKIPSQNAFGISMPVLRKYARTLPNNHKLALELWDSGYHEARILASLKDEPQQVTKSQINNWTNDFYSWDLCDQVCINLWQKTSFAWENTLEFISAEKEFVKRTAFTMMAVMAVHHKKVPDKNFLPLLKLILENCDDNRIYVKKAVNWALRQIGKRSEFLKKEAIKTAHEMLKIENASALWIARDALRELKNTTPRKKDGDS